MVQMVPAGLLDNLCRTTYQRATESTLQLIIAAVMVSINEWQWQDGAMQ